ncbi:hypothetical protein BDN71DRAFT_1433211 [Pleurotus eryngii]|uniref:Uncharacterized protein n=1 Tax=Pleurotus eryngii TaxID=5323 RepID=A0A9P6D5Z5_PLEER|nr:hypothetical protein BDN71DRAFT_1433211 [Pleurotus eryngii]
MAMQTNTKCKREDTTRLPIQKLSVPSTLERPNYGPRNAKGVAGGSASTEDKGVGAGQRPAKKRKEYIPCQPPTMKEGSSKVKLSIEWTVKKRLVWEGEKSREIVQIVSPFADQVEGTPTSCNPHWSPTRPTPPTPTNPNCKFPITNAAFPNVTLPEAAILGNVRKEMANELKQNPAKYLALLPLGAGNKLYENAREITRAAARLVSAMVNNNNRYTVAAPVREGDPPYGARFAKPFAMILKEPSVELRCSLLRDEGIGHLVEDRIHVAIASMSMVYIDRADDKGRDDPVWQLHGRPAANDEKKYREWLRAVCQIKFFLDETTELDSERNPVGCVGCKSETHTNSSCPVPKVQDWLGPNVTNDQLAPEPRDVKTSREGKRKGKGKGKAARNM